MIDEKNGIVLDAALVGGALVSQFRVGNNLLLTRYEPRLGGDRLPFEIVVFAADDVRKTEPTQNGTGPDRTRSPPTASSPSSAPNSPASRPADHDQ